MLPTATTAVDLLCGGAKWRRHHSGVATTDCGGEVPPEPASWTAAATVVEAAIRTPSVGAVVAVVVAARLCGNTCSSVDSNTSVRKTLAIDEARDKVQSGG